MDTSDTLPELTEKLALGENLLPFEAECAAHALTSAAVGDDEKKRFLMALSAKGETVTEVTAFASVFRKLAKDPGLDDFADRAIDVVGTGGDRFGSYNISTTAALVLAAAGVPVLKHGNRAITSNCGSSEFLTALGIHVQPEPGTLRASVEELNFCFLFAPAYHPAFKEIMPVRQSLAKEGHRTIFNILGPLINPAQPAHQLMGVYSERWVEPLANVLGELGLVRGLVIHGRLSEGSSGLDEITSAGDNVMRGFGELSSFNKIVSPETLGLSLCQPEVLKGGTAEQNREMLDELVHGRSHQGLEDTVCLNAGAGFLAVGSVSSLQAGYEMARDALLGGSVASWLLRAREFYCANSKAL